MLIGLMNSRALKLMKVRLLVFYKHQKDNLVQKLLIQM